MHDFGMFSIERIGKTKFQRHWGVNIEREIRKLTERYEEYLREQERDIRRVIGKSRSRDGTARHRERPAKKIGD